MIPTEADLLRLLPELVLAAFGIMIMLLAPVIPRATRGRLGYLALVGSLTALVATAWTWDNPGTAFSNLIIIDGFSVFLHILLLVITALTILASLRYLERENINHGEYYALLLFATIGMGLMASANELMMVFLGLETSSIATYVLAGFRRTQLRSNESALKYFLLGSFATAFLLYGIALVFGATGTTFLPEIQSALRLGQFNPTLVWLGMAMLFVGLGFKVATAPFQVWTPDVYEGAPTPVTAFLSAGPKAAAFAAFLRIFFTAFEPVSDVWMDVVFWSAVLTMFVGNLGALLQTNVKRMLAYSSIAHAGYILIAFAARNELGIAAVLFYLVAYALMKLGAFSVVAHVAAGEERQEVEDFAGLAAREPWLAACLALFMFSLIGFPLTGGFFGKYYIFSAALQSGLVWLVVLGVLNSALSVPYYLRVVKVMYMSEPRAGLSVEPVPASLAFVLTLTALGTIYLGLLPNFIWRSASQSTLPLP